MHKGTGKREEDSQLAKQPRSFPDLETTRNIDRLAAFGRGIWHARTAQARKKKKIKNKNKNKRRIEAIVLRCRPESSEGGGLDRPRSHVLTNL